MRRLFQKSAKRGLFPLVIGVATSALLLISFLYLRPQLNLFTLSKRVVVLSNGSPLTPVEPLQRQLVAGESHSYQLALVSGQYLRILIEPSGLNAGASIFAPGNRKIAEFDCRQNKSTPYSIVAEVTGTYHLDIRSLKINSESGRYQLRIEELREGQPGDHHRISADRAFNEGERSRASGAAESLRNAINKYEEAAQAWRNIGDEKKEAYALKAAGEIYFPLGEIHSSFNHYERALQIYRKLHDQQGEGETLNAIVEVYLSRGESEIARRNCDQALDISRTIGDRRIEALSLNNIGEVYNWSGNLQKALEYYQKAQPIWVDLGDHYGQAQTLLYFGYTYSDMGDVKKSLAHYEQALSLWQAIDNYRGQAQTLTAMGRLFSRLGDSQKALDFFDRAMKLAQMVGDRLEQARIFNGRGYIHERLGDNRTALDCYTDALKLFKAVSYRNGEASTLQELGRVWSLIGENEIALDYFQKCYALSRAIADQHLSAYALRGMGMSYGSKGNQTKALKYYKQALPLYHLANDRRGEASVLNLIGRLYHGRGQGHLALGYYRRALQLNQEAGDRIHQSLTLYNIASAERDRGYLKHALGQIEAALQIVESLRAEVASRDLRTSYFASIQQYYELAIDLLMRQREDSSSKNFAAAALEASERARMRSLIELLAEARAEIRQDGDPTLIQRAGVLLKQINGLAERKAKQIGANAPQNEINDTVEEITALSVERDKVEAQIRIKSPRYAALTQPQPSSLSEIQGLLDDNTILLEYALGAERSYLWAVTRTDLKSYQLPARARIENIARSVYELLSSPQQGSDKSEKRRAAEYWGQASKLSGMILKPVSGLLGSKRILVVGDGVLQYIPFAALPISESGKQMDKSANGGEKGKTNSVTHVQRSIPLIVRHEIVNLPSASTLSVLRRETAGRRPAPKTIAVLADPVFQADDLRALAAIRKSKGAPENRIPIINPLNRDLGRMRSGEVFERLHATENEARAIEEVTSDSERLVVRGFDANRALVTGPELSQYRIVHFATHAVLDRDNPELSAIVLSLFDQQGKSQEGLLRLHDIYNLNLPAELVTLSACNTGLGKEIKGEGLIGLTRGFMYAGSARVLASLWKVEDEATSNLMRRFYRNLLKEKMGPAAALRNAQIALWQDTQWSSPSWWSAFTLQGEWK